MIHSCWLHMNPQFKKAAACVSWLCLLVVLTVHFWFLWRFNFQVINQGRAEAIRGTPAIQISISFFENTACNITHIITRFCAKNVTSRIYI